MRTLRAPSALVLAIVALVVIAVIAPPGRPSLAQRVLRHFGLEPRITASLPQPGRPLALAQPSFVAMGDEPPQPERPRGRPMLIDIFATWCPPCRQELAAIAVALPTLEQHGVQVVGIDRAETAGQVRATMQTFGLQYPVYIDTGATESWASLPHVIPTTIFIDAHGVVRFVHSGPLQAPELVQLVRLAHA